MLTSSGIQTHSNDELKFPGNSACAVLRADQVCNGAAGCALVNQLCFSFRNWPCEEAAIPPPYHTWPSRGSPTPPVEQCIGQPDRKYIHYSFDMFGSNDFCQRPARSSPVQSWCESWPAKCNARRVEATSRSHRRPYQNRLYFLLRQMQP